jgi:alpha-L-fucosidase 2
MLIASPATEPQRSVTPAGVLWYDRPGERWFEALPIGNGRLGGMVYGGVPAERIDLSESTVWSGGPSAADLSRTARAELPAIRKLLFAGEYAKAQQLAGEHLLGTRASFGTNLPLPHVSLTFSGAPATSYRRSLDLDTGIVTVAYEQDGIGFTREVLASHPHGVIAVRLSTDPAGTDQPGTDRTGADDLGANRTGAAHAPGAISFTLGIGGAVFPGRTSVTETGVAFSGRAVESVHSDGTVGAAVEIRVHVAAEGGSVRTGDTYEVIGADSAVLIIAVGTDWAGEDPVRRAEELTAAAVEAGYEAIRSAHVEDHSALMRRVSIDLGVDSLDTTSEPDGEPDGEPGAEPAGGLPTDRRRERLAGGERDDGLLALYFQYGRYLTVAGSRADSPLPLALQGLWNDGLASSASWSNDFHLDVNTEQNYWAAEPTNLAECHTPVFRFLQLLADSGQTTATQMYDAPGWVAHTVTNAWGYTAPGTDLGWGLNVTGGAWLATHLWEHYEYGRDDDFLRNTAYPVLRGAAEFLLSYLAEDPTTGHLVAGPSESPENWYVAPNGSRGSVAMGNTVDRVFTEAILRDCAAAATVLDVDPQLRDRIIAARSRLTPYQIGKHGQLQEWLHDFDEADPAHRHTSHLCALYPERQISPQATPELARAAEVTIERRQSAAGWEQTEWVEANFALFFARLRQGDKALAHVTSLVADASEANLLSYSVGGIAGAAQNIYSFDGNAGGTAAVAELLVQSDGAELDLLPALPTTWTTGSVRGLRARGGLTIDLTWTNGRLDAATIHPDRPTTQRIRYDGETTELTLDEPTTIRVAP